MAGLEDVVQGIGIEGGAEALSTLRELGDVGERTFQKIEKAVQNSSGGFETFSIGIGGVAAALGVAGGAILSFVEAQDRLIQRLGALSQSFGASIEQIEGIKESFASVGIGGQALERSLNRLQTAIGNQWSAIQREVSTSAESQKRSMTSIESAALGLEKAYDRVKEANKNAHEASIHNAESARGAALSLEAAHQTLLETTGGKNAVSKGEKDTLKLKQEELAVDKAKQTLAEANQKISEASHKAYMAEREAALGVKKAKEAIVEADQKAAETQLKNLPAIADQLNSIASGYGSIKGSIDLTEVSAQNLAKAMILAASGGGGSAPTGLEVYTKMTAVFEQLGTSADAMRIKMELVQRLLNAGFRQGTASAAEIVAAISKGPAALNELASSAEKSSYKLSESQVKAATETVSAWAKLGSILDKVQNYFAALASSSVTSFLESVNKSLESETGALHVLVNLVVDFGKSWGWIGDVVEALGKLLDKIGAVGTAIKASGLGAIIGGTVGAVVSTALGMGPIPGMIAGGTLGATLTGAEGYKTGREQGQSVIGERPDDPKIAAKAAYDKTMADIAQGREKKAAGDKFDAAHPGAPKNPEQTRNYNEETAAANKKLAESAEIAAKSLAKTAVAADKDKALSAKSESSAIAASKETIAGGLASSVARLLGIGGNWRGGPVGGKSIPGFARGGIVGFSAGGYTGSMDEKKDNDALRAAEVQGDNDTYYAIRHDINGKKAQEQQQKEEEWKKQEEEQKKADEEKKKKPWDTGRGGDYRENRAEGGSIQGPGSGTSDSIVARLSNGEFVVQAAAVRAYGVNLFERLNNMAISGFALGGPVMAGVRSPGGESRSSSAGSILNLSIDGNHFNGLHAPADVAARLTTYAIGRQTASTGRKPSWMG